MVTSVTQEREDCNYDFTVPIYHNYFADGVIHHNCGKTCNVVYGTILSLMGYHPVPEKNLDYWHCECGKKWNFRTVPAEKICPSCKKEITVFRNTIRTIRFCSETLPGETTDEKGGLSTEVRNTLYPETRKWLPSFMIKKDITARSPKMIVKTLTGADAVIEWVSYGQSTQSTAGTQRWKIVLDEEAPKPFYEEQLPRLLAADGWLEIALTPANYISYMHDEIFDRASIYYRSKVIADKFGLREVEKIRDDNQICVVMAATDDNVTLRPEVVDRMFENYDDPDVVDIRRFGRFKAISGRVFKDFEFATHVIDPTPYFPDGVPDDGLHARGIDYHGRNPWACVWAWLSNDDELFIVNDMNPSPERQTTEAIAHDMAQLSGDYHYHLNLADPLIKATQLKPNWTTLDDLNESFRRLKKAGIGTGGYWEVWDTKSERGRDNIKLRLKNSLIAGKPFQNGGKPTIWIFSRCKNVATSFKNWRYSEYANTSANASKESRNEVEQKHSHFPMAIEGLLKDIRLRPRRPGFWGRSREFQGDRYFRRERATA